MSLILDWLFPKSCLKCGQNGKYFCSNCLKPQVILSPKISPVDKKFEGIISLFKYKSIIKKGIIEIKYNFVFDICNELANIVSQNIISNYPQILKYWQNNKFAIVPIPLHYFRENWRGYNQSLILSQIISQNLKLDFNPNILIRSVNTPAQVKQKSKRNRLKNVKNAFQINLENKLEVPPKIILFDDVFTTGSTLNSAFETIKPYGLTHCWYLTIAA